MYYPKQFKNGDTIEIIAPSNGICINDLKKLDRSIDYLKKNGYKIIEGENVRKSNNGVSASREKRALELNAAFKNNNSSLLLACTGGDFCVDILDLVDFDIYKKNPKWIQGHSDITSILYYITVGFDIATMYSFNCKRISRCDLFPSDMIINNMKLLNHDEIIQKDYEMIISEGKVKSKSKWKCITNLKNVKGRIIGGCLECLKDIIGTKYDCTNSFIKKYKNDGIIWFFDIYDMTNEDVFRTMWQLKHNGWFDCTNAILIGRLYEEKTFTNLDLKTALLNSLKDLNIPIIINADIGHTDPVISIVNGALVEIVYDNGYLIKTYFN